MQAWHALLANGTPHRFIAGEVLVRQGEYGRHVLALNHGRVKVIRLEPDGNEMVLAVRGRGEILRRRSAQHHVLKSAGASRGAGLRI